MYIAFKLLCYGIVLQTKKRPIKRPKIAQIN